MRLTPSALTSSFSDGSFCPAGHSPSHRELDRVWRQAEEAGIPVVFHVGGTGALIDANYFNSGLGGRLPRPTARGHSL